MIIAILPNLTVSSLTNQLPTPSDLLPTGWRSCGNERMDNLWNKHAAAVSLLAGEGCSTLLDFVRLASATLHVYLAYGSDNTDHGAFSPTWDDSNPTIAMLIKK